MFPSWQLSHCGAGACQQSYIWNVNWIFHWLPLGKQRCVSLQERRADEQGLGVGKRSKPGYMGISLPQDVVLILPFPCRLYPTSQFMKGSKLNIWDVIATWRPWLSF